MKCPHCNKDIGQWVAKEIGTMGGKTTYARHGKKQYSEMGKKGNAVRWGKVKADKK
jgi:general stress protein YciG